MKFIRANLLYFLILFFLGVVVFFYRLDSIPSGFYIDEALPGYNAYSLLLTGKDEYGKSFPLVLRFYGSFNPPLYTYLTIPFVSLFGLNIFAVRFLSALSGLLLSIVIFILLKSSNFVSQKASFFGALFFLITPWIILHSRVGYEVSLALLLFSLGVFFVWKGLSDKKYLITGFVFLSLSTYAAYTERFIVPMFILSFLFLFRRQVFSIKSRITLFKAVFILFITQLPHFYLLTTQAFFPKSNLLSTGAITSAAEKIGYFLPSIVSTPLAFSREFFSQYFTYFSPKSLFFLPDPDMQRSIPELSVFYFWMIIPYLIGVYSLWKKKREDFLKIVILLAVLSPIPAAMTKDPFSTHRALPLVLPVIVIITIGIDQFLKNVSPRIWIPTLLLLFLFSSLLLWRSYFVLLPKERARYWGYGIEKLAETIMTNPDEHFIIDQARIKPVYIQIAFFLKYSPSQFQTKVDQSIKNRYYNYTEFNPVYNFANLETRNINWKEDIYKKQILVGDELAISQEQVKEHFLIEVFEVKDPIGEIVLVGYETNPKEKCAKTRNLNLKCKRQV